MKTALKVKIIAFVDDSQPGFVKCTFTDVFGKEWFIVDKVPIVTDEYLDETSTYPRNGIIFCSIEKQMTDDVNDKIVVIDISKPINISTEDGETIFSVFKNQIINPDNWTGKA